MIGLIPVKDEECCGIAEGSYIALASRFFFDICAARTAFIRGLLNDSAWAFARGHASRCNSAVMRSYVFSEFLKCCGVERTLSDLITLGIPNAEITLSRTGIVALAEVEDVTSTTGYLENSSVITNR